MPATRCGDTQPTLSPMAEAVRDAFFQTTTNDRSAYKHRKAEDDPSRTLIDTQSDR